MPKQIYPDRVRCLADREGLEAFEIDGNTYHAADRKEAEQMHKDGAKPTEETTLELFQ
jgi:hypothetical protein